MQFKQDFLFYKKNNWQTMDTKSYCKSNFLDEDHKVKTCLMYFNETLSQRIDQPERSKRENTEVFECKCVLRIYETNKWNTCCHCAQ
jgi:hypothetical protein